MFTNWLNNVTSGFKPPLLRLVSQLMAADLPAGVTLVTSPAMPVRGHGLHPCVIQQRPTLIHAVDLAEQNPDLYRAVQQFARVQGYQLQPERRQHSHRVGRERRRLIPALLLTVGMQTALAKPPQEHATQQVKQLALYQNTLQLPEDAVPRNELRSETAEVEEDLLLTAEVEPVLAILQQHFRASEHDPEYLQTDLMEMAVYFSRYPAAVELLQALADANWQLRFKPDQFRTEVRGSRFRVSSAIIYFDSRAAAQLRQHRACEEKLGACIASPADALLHELLHAKSALLESAVFIEQGGLNSVLYPFAHERTVIQQENRLYAAMSRLDGHSRPQRHQHSGRLAAADCVTCIR